MFVITENFIYSSLLYPVFTVQGKIYRVSCQGPSKLRCSTMCVPCRGHTIHKINNNNLANQYFKIFKKSSFLNLFAPQTGKVSPGLVMLCLAYFFKVWNLLILIMQTATKQWKTSKLIPVLDINCIL